MGRVKDWVSLCKVGTEIGGATVIAEVFFRWNGKQNIPYCWVKCKCGAKKIRCCHGLGKTVCCRKCAGKWISKVQTTHGESNTKLYEVWYGMVDRCYKRRINGKGRAAYDNYGGRGIRVSEEWVGSFESFRDWARISGYEEGLEIDRIDNNGDYKPDNCRWASCKQQARNKRTNHLVTAFGETKCVMEWMEDPRCAVKKPITLYARLRNGYLPEDAITEPISTNRRRLKRKETHQ